MYPAATNSFKETGTRRCSTLNFRSACVNCSKAVATAASDATAETPTFVSTAAFVARGELSLPHPMHSTKAAKLKNTRSGITLFCVWALKFQVVSRFPRFPQGRLCRSSTESDNCGSENPGGCKERLSPASDCGKREKKEGRRSCRYSVARRYRVADPSTPSRRH